MVAGKGASLRAPEGPTPVASRPGTPCILPPGTPATPAGAGMVDTVAAPAAAECPAQGGDVACEGSTSLHEELMEWMATSTILSAAVAILIQLHLWP